MWAHLAIPFLLGITESWQIISSHFLQQVWTVARTLKHESKCWVTKPLGHPCSIGYIQPLAVIFCHSSQTYTLVINRTKFQKINFLNTPTIGDPLLWGSAFNWNFYHLFLSLIYYEFLTTRLIKSSLQFQRWLENQDTLDHSLSPYLIDFDFFRFYFRVFDNLSATQNYQDYTVT